MYCGWHLKLQVHLPACGPINLNNSPEIMAEKYPLRKRINGNLTFNGELSYLATKLPSGEPAKLFWTDRANTLFGAVCSKPVEIKVLPACSICGDEEHGDEECLYLPLLNGCPIHTETTENNIMEVSPPRPERKPKPQKKTENPPPSGGKKASGVQNGH
ncbi:hypothetical protein PtB15_11B319 [Puccinia triticina]|nr:hypothetical protein PtB15_11B319 [Puccinia triticina]